MEIFPKGQSMVLVNYWLFFHFIILGVVRQEISFTVFQNEKKLFKATKAKSSKSQNLRFFLFFFSGPENAFLCYENQAFKESKNCDFSKQFSPWFWSKICHFFHFFILCRIGQENVVYDILEPKNTFLGYKNKKFKHLKI